MILGLRRTQIVRLYLCTAAALGSAAYVSGAVSADICHAYQNGRVASLSSAERPPLCS
jgi:hypothetical protein